MQLENKQQKSIIIALFFYSILTIGCIMVFIFFLYPGLKDIQNVKAETSSLYTQIQESQAKGIWFEVFSTQAIPIAATPYETQLVKNFDKNTYNEVFTHTGTTSYNEFLENKTQQLTQQAVQKSPDHDIVAQLLPIYGWDVEDPATLSDFKFVNYVESILETFSLQYEGLIGIGNLHLVESFSSAKNKNSLETSIFYIPLELQVTGSKGSILDFFHYIENSGKISLLEESIIPYSDSTLTLWRLPIVLEWDAYTPGYNIYQNPIVDIASVSMKEYIDSSVYAREDQDFIDFIKQTRWNEVFSFDITLHFYVKGLPQYKIENKITGIIKDYQKIQSEVNAKRKQPQLTEVEKINLEKISDYLQSLASDIKALQANLKKQTRLQDMYTQAQDIEVIFTNIRNQALSPQK